MCIRDSEPTIEEIARNSDISIEEAKRVMKISKHPISLDRPIGESDDSYFGDFIEDESAESPIQAAGHEMLKERIDEVLSTLTFREREIVKLRYGIGDGYTYTLEEVGRIFRVTRERVRQIEAKAVRKLRHPVRARQLAGFLDGVKIPDDGELLADLDLDSDVDIEIETEVEIELEPKAKVEVEAEPEVDLDLDAEVEEEV